MRMADYCRCRRRYMAQPRVILYWAENSTIYPTSPPLYANSRTKETPLRFMLPTALLLYMYIYVCVYRKRRETIFGARKKRRDDEKDMLPVYILQSGINYGRWFLPPSLSYKQLIITVEYRYIPKTLSAQEKSDERGLIKWRRFIILNHYLYEICLLVHDTIESISKIFAGEI